MNFTTYRLLILFLICNQAYALCAQNNIRDLNNYVKEYINEEYQLLVSHNPDRPNPIFADFDLNGRSDVAATYYSVLDKTLYTVILLQKDNVYKIEGILPFENVEDTASINCTLGYDSGMLSIEYSLENDSITLFESYNYRYDFDAFRLVSENRIDSKRQEEEGTANTFNLNYDNMEAKTSFEKWGTEEGFVSQNSFKILAANLAGESITLDGEFDEYAWQNAVWTSIKEDRYIIEGKEKRSDIYDLHLNMATIWNKDSFYIGLEVIDDAFVPVFTTEGSLSGDHVQFLFQFAPEKNKNNPHLISTIDCSVANPSRERNENTLHLAVGPISDKFCQSRVLYPKQNYIDFKFDAICVVTEKGYRIEIQMPTNEIGIWNNSSPNLAEDERFVLVGFSLLLADTDKNSKPESYLSTTSKLDTKNPSTYGRIFRFDNYQEEQKNIGG
ncbi:MAG: hypothetical protein MK212_06350 [Saprospiraceae bacterium]|nr:hypothetical protein [Saprospiraceae bacterium]